MTKKLKLLLLIFISIALLAAYNIGIIAYQMASFFHDRGQYTWAFSLYQIAEKNGVKEAYYYQGYLYLKGYGVEQNINKAERMFEKALIVQDYGTYSFLGWAYYQGEHQGFSKDEKKGYFWQSVYECKTGSLDRLESRLSWARVWKNGALVTEIKKLSDVCNFVATIKDEEMNLNIYDKWLLTSSVSAADQKKQLP